MEKKIISTKEEARQYAIEWQSWQSEQSMSMGEVQEWYFYFSNLAKKLDLVEEFKENGII